MICSLAQGGRLLSRSFSSSATPSSNTPGLLEWRRYKIRFEGMQEFLRLTEESAALRKSLHPGWLGFFTPDTGGCLTSVHHIYHYDDMLHRQEVRAKASEDEGWVKRLMVGVVLAIKETTSNASQGRLLGVLRAPQGCPGCVSRNLLLASKWVSPASWRESDRGQGEEENRRDRADR